MRALAAALLVSVFASPALADQNFPATVQGHAVLPAATFQKAPADAPAFLATSGKFAGAAPTRIEGVGTVPGMAGARPTGLSLPFEGQPVQGFSGIETMPDGTFWVLTDNGFGSKANSPDAMLTLGHYRIDFKTGGVERIEGIYLSDPDKKVPFRIVTEATDERYLTGSDFDIESFQIIGDKIWFGDEFGPYLLRADRSGKVEAVFETLADGKPVRSPDNPLVSTPATPDGKVVFNARRSKGFEGMAASADGKLLYALLEGPLWDTQKGAYENDGGKQYLRILEFDVAGQKWTGRFWKYPLEANGNAIGDFNMIDATTGLIIERDDGEGTVDQACPTGQTRADCFPTPAKFKRVYKIELNDANAGAAVRKVGHIDLMAMRDPEGIARQGGKDGTLTFPFQTIENVDVIDATHIIVGNDNNLPFSAGRRIDKADDGEFVLLEVGDFLKAR
ncbi:esterase-like activity of phytase family protein [Chelatococcus sp. GCM10030263]|uniref:esterase-like activity of phytase family protein n=1 Tax=Chelatococcus sp. GCM10030263 TaxID=3273387 RepID=UPI003613768F